MPYDAVAPHNVAYTRGLRLPRLAAALTLMVFVNSALLFIVEPMFSKLALPLLGGTPSVWNTCLVFFQAALLVGYAYAHLATQKLGVRRQTLLHLGLLGISCIWLPLALRPDSPPPPGGMGVLWLIGALTVSLGLPFVMLASGAPLAQRWLAESGDPDAENPYFLYAASNLGSLCALLSYPLLIEPWLSLSAQRAAWSLAYGGLLVLIGACVWMLRRRNRTDAGTPTRHKSIDSVGFEEPAPTASAAATHESAAASAAPVTADRARWVLYSAVPSSLLLGVTTYISTDIAAFPLVWIIPLALYLVTFVVVFSRRQLIPHNWTVFLEPHVLIFAALALFWGVRFSGALTTIAVNLAVFFVVALVAHGELASLKPAPRHLTEFFVWISVGGLIGGVFNALVAPLVFDAPHEYRIALALAGLIRPARGDTTLRQKVIDVALPLALGIALYFLTRSADSVVGFIPIAATLAVIIALLASRNRPVRFALGLAAIFVAANFRATYLAGSSATIFAGRSFFGITRVTESRQYRERTLHHGTTMHGRQSLEPTRHLAPLTYYHEGGPAGDLFALTPAGMRQVRRVGVVGLGTGSLACYGRPAEQWTFHEIDPLIVRIAADPRLFTFLRNCLPRVNVLLGDGRVTMRQVPHATYDMLVLDAFSSDAIPVHMLTREALRVYLNALAPGGVIALHISNRHMDLAPVIARLVDDAGVAGRIRVDAVPRSELAKTGRTASEWVAIGRTEADLGQLAEHKEWHRLKLEKNVGLWTDDFSNIISIMHWK